MSLKRHLRWYYITFYGGIGVAGALLILILWFGGNGIANAVRNRQLAMTPSPTITRTATTTPTITLTPTITSTPTPEATSTPNYTPTPTPVITGLVTRDLYAYSGCYESTNQNGKIPEGGEVTIIALPDRAFDDLGRECVLVEYKGETRTVIGYILVADLSIP